MSYPCSRIGFWCSNMELYISGDNVISKIKISGDFYILMIDFSFDTHVSHAQINWFTRLQSMVIFDWEHFSFLSCKNIDLLFLSSLLIPTSPLSSVTQRDKMPFSVTMSPWSVSLWQSLSVSAAATLGFSRMEASLQLTAACSAVHLQLDGFARLRLLVS